MREYFTLNLIHLSSLPIYKKIFISDILDTGPARPAIVVRLPNGEQVALKVNGGQHPAPPVALGPMTAPSALAPGPLPAPAAPFVEGLRNYSTQLMEFGLLYKNFIESIQVPNRPRMLRTLKLMMALLKADNGQSKYAYEILRFLIYQYFLLSKSEAHLVFYSMFVNTKGQLNTHIPADLQMEYIVRVIKKHIKHMFSNKTERNIERKTGALAGLSAIVNNYDHVSNVLTRSKKHSAASSFADEVSIIEDLRELKPFEPNVYSSHGHFKTIRVSALAHLDYAKYHQWLMVQSIKHSTSLGN